MASDQYKLLKPHGTPYIQDQASNLSTTTQDPALAMNSESEQETCTDMENGPTSFPFKLEIALKECPLSTQETQVLAVSIFKLIGRSLRIMAIQSMITNLKY